MKQARREEEFLRIEAAELSELFSSQEGRRPRLLIADLDTFHEKKLHEVAGFFADLGCNVDIAPKTSNLSDIERQCLENDTDMLLILAGDCVRRKEFHEFQRNIFSGIPHLKAALCSSDSKRIADRQKNELSWSFFDHNETPIIIASSLLQELVLNN